MSDYWSLIETCEAAVDAGPAEPGCFDVGPAEIGYC